MVTKLTGIVGALREGSVLAKILMVTKLKGKRTNQEQLFCSSKNPYGNKTV